MTQVTVSQNIKKSHATMALMALDSYFRKVLEPHYQAKIEKLPDRHRSTRTAGLWSSRINRARSALNDLRYEIESMPDSVQ